MFELVGIDLLVDHPYQVMVTPERRDP